MKSQDSTVAILIPVYNEETVITSVIKPLVNRYRYVICVDDGSTDNSIEAIESCGAFLVKHPINMGQGAALQTGIEFARQFKKVNYFATFDADGQHRIEDLESLVKEIKKNEYDIILGSRFLGSADGITISKKAILKMAIKFTNLSSRLKLTDTHNGLRIFNRKFAENIQITMPGMAHASEILEIIRDKQFTYKEHPVVIKYTKYSVSKGQSLANAINIGFDTMLRKLS